MARLDVRNPTNFRKLPIYVTIRFYVSSALQSRALSPSHGRETLSAPASLPARPWWTDCCSRYERPRTRARDRTRIWSRAGGRTWCRSSKRPSPDLSRRNSPSWSCPARSCRPSVGRGRAVAVRPNNRRKSRRRTPNCCACRPAASNTRRCRRSTGNRRARRACTRCDGGSCRVGSEFSSPISVAAARVSIPGRCCCYLGSPARTENGKLLLVSRHRAMRYEILNIIKSEACIFFGVFTRVNIP